mmetsp:Transcript_17717/g.71110  ORF Transcript_17717/g.71110 Transcript_17717/m.71110 type:complete len:201 (-) Transcript_17717:53-655(-)
MRVPSVVVDVPVSRHGQHRAERGETSTKVSWERQARVAQLVAHHGDTEARVAELGGVSGNLRSARESLEVLGFRAHARSTQREARVRPVERAVVDEDSARVTALDAHVGAIDLAPRDAAARPRAGLAVRVVLAERPPHVLGDRRVAREAARNAAGDAVHGDDRLRIEVPQQLHEHRIVDAIEERGQRRPVAFLGRAPGSL